MDILGIITGLNSNVKPSDYMSTLSSNAVFINSSNTVVTKSNASASLPLSTQTLLNPLNTVVTKTTVPLSTQTVLNPVNTGITKTTAPLSTQTLLSPVSTGITKSNASAAIPLSTQTILSPANAGLIKTNASQTILKPLNTAVSVSLQGMIPYHSCIPVGAMYNQNGGDFNVLTPVYLSTSIVGETSSEPQESTCIIN